MKEKKIKDKQISTAWMAWNEKNLNWGEILIVNIQKEISRKKNPMILLASGYLNVLCKEALDGVVNLAAMPLEMKGLEDEETNKPGKQAVKASSSSPSSSNPSSRFQLAISHRGKKRQREDFKDS
jgi:hypothetical protein